METTLNGCPYLEEEIFLSVPPSHHLAKQKSIALHEAANEPFFSRTSGYGFRDVTDEYCREADFEPYTPIELEEAGAILRLVEMGMGVSFTPQLSLLRQSMPKTVQIPITYLSQAAIDFREFTSGFFKHEVSKYFYL
ncbi:LysR substrate-binding domain-containing protein [Peribacillus butanolivorans]|uniref:LysR substrate-binding domain-containing protein n=1 Tax=Peribacillus butanolivorans TaxID=421767 RepID=UPI003813066A